LVNPTKRGPLRKVGCDLDTDDASCTGYKKIRARLSFMVDDSPYASVLAEHALDFLNVLGLQQCFLQQHT
jgi:hypothetical protein